MKNKNKSLDEDRMIGSCSIWFKVAGIIGLLYSLFLTILSLYHL